MSEMSDSDLRPIHPLGVLHKQISIGDICKIDLRRVNMGKIYAEGPDQYKFLGFEQCSGTTCNSCKVCHGNMRFENMRTRKTSVSCYGYATDTPVVLLFKTLPDELFEI